MSLRAQRWFMSARENSIAVQSTTYCGNYPEFSLPESLTPWFTAVTARCRGDLAQEQGAWQEILSYSDARLDVVRTARPLDLELARIAASQYPQQAVAYFWLGNALREVKDITGAIAVYEAGLRLAPRTALIWDYLGRLYEETGALDKATHAYDQACTYVDRGKNGCLHAGRLYLELGMHEKAVTSYRTSLKQLPGYAHAHRGLAAALLALDRPAEAIPHLQALAAKGDTKAQQQLQELTQEE